MDNWDSVDSTPSTQLLSPILLIWSKGNNYTTLWLFQVYGLFIGNGPVAPIKQTLISL